MASTLLNEVDAAHPEYKRKRLLLKRCRDLYLGGEHMRANAGEYLLKRQKEPADVYAERLSRVYYENHIGSIIDWYVATLFRREPVVIAEGDDAIGKKFLNDFTEDCDLRGSSLAEFFRRQILDALICGESYVLADFPRVATAAGSLAEEESGGTSRAYLGHCAPEQLINWSTDERGEFEWVVIRNTSLRKDGFRSGDWKEESRWLYYDRENFEIYLRRDAKEEPFRIDHGRHGFARQKRVPLFPLRLSEGLWLMNRAGTLQLEHFNKANALAWALTQGLFAMPVIYSDREWNQIMGESYFMQLGPQDRLGWAEPEGHVYQVAADNLRSLREEIYRVCYLMTQAGGSLVQSGLSKQRDFAVTQEVLRSFGDTVKDAMKRVLRAVVEARQDRLSIDVSGLDEFDIGDFGGELADAERLLSLGVNSPTLKKQIFKKLAFKYLCDVRQELKDRIGAEIDAGSE